MTGHERDAAAALASGVLLSIVLNIAFIPLWGVEGVAIATSASMMSQNLLMALLAYSRTGIHSTALGRISFRRNRKKG
jgi:O-antigen/teichoic acid export membrane protein